MASAGVAAFGAERNQRLPTTGRNRQTDRQMDRQMDMTSELVAAAAADKADDVKRLLSRGANPNAKQQQTGITPLTSLCQSGSSLDICRQLLDAGADPNLPNSAGFTPLLLVTRRNQLPLASMLIDRGANPNAEEPNLHWTPLIASVTSSEMAQLLLSAGARVNQTSSDGTALARATSLGNSKCVQLLLSQGAQPNLGSSDNYGPLAFAAQKGHLDCARLLLEGGADVNFRTRAGYTPLNVAAQNRQGAMAALLLDFNADPNIEEKKFNWTPLITAVYVNDEVIVNRLLADERTDVNRVGMDGTAMAVAASFGNVVMINKLVARRADANLADEEGYAPLHWAAQNGHTDAVDALLKAGADATRLIKSGLSVIRLAVCNGHSDTLQRLLRHPMPQELRQAFIADSVNLLQGSTIGQNAIDADKIQRMTQMLCDASPSALRPSPALPSTVGSDKPEGVLDAFSFGTGKSAEDKSWKSGGSVRGVVMRVIDSNPVLPREYIQRQGLQSNTVQFLNHGNFGWVYQARRSNGQMIVMKVVSLASRSPWEAAARLSEVSQREIVIMKQLNHENIVKFYSSELVSNCLVICMEFIEGSNLRQCLRDRGSGLPEQLQANYFKQICRAIAYMHENRICHRDIKCENVMLQTGSGIIKIIDFGLSKKIHHSDMLQTPVGSPLWTAPEVLLSINSESQRKYDPMAADVYSLGCTLHEMATTKPPLVDKVPHLHLLNYHFNNRNQFLPDTEIRRMSGRRICEIFLRCTHKNPRDRPTVREVLEEMALRGV